LITESVAERETNFHYNITNMITIIFQVCFRTISCITYTLILQLI